jgi:hypothetical protein
MHLNGDYPLNFPYFLLKILAKMSKRVQSHPATAKSSLFHQVLIKTLVVSSLREVQKPWSWLIQSLNLDPQPSKQKKGKGKRSVAQEPSFPVDETPVKEEFPAIRVTRTNRGKRPKLETENEMFSKANLKIEEDFDKDYDVKPSAKHKAPETSKRGVAVKRQRKKYVPVSQKPRRNSTRITNKYRLRSKAMFDPSIKKEDVIVIEDHSEDAKTDIKQRENKPPLHKEPAKRDKQVIASSTGPITRATTRLSRAKASVEGISRVPESTESHLVDSDHISDIPEAMDSSSSDEEHNSGLVSRYQIKLREPKANINLNEPAPTDEFPEFKVKVRTDKEKIRELQKVVKQLKKEKAHVEQWSAR